MHLSMSRRTQQGFTLVELMITVVVISILLGIAVPSYRQHVVRSKRTAAQAAMMDIANREQQFLLANRAYADKPTLEANGYVLPAEVSESYSWNVVPGAGSSPSFTITFTGTGGQAADGALSACWVWQDCSRACRWQRWSRISARRH
jgi:type IV pilus assembly protein PilE